MARLTIALAAAARKPATTIDKSSIAKALSKDDLKFLKGWILDGRTSSKDALAIFKRIKADLLKAGMDVSQPSTDIWRGINMSLETFKEFIVSGKLPTSKGRSVESWTGNFSSAALFAMNLGMSFQSYGPMCVILKRPKGTWKSVIDLNALDVALRGSESPDEDLLREVVLVPSPAVTTEVDTIFMHPHLDRRDTEETHRMFSELRRLGRAGNIPTYKDVFFSVVDGKLKMKKPPKGLYDAMDDH